jgi:hypothetical protein
MLFEHLLELLDARVVESDMLLNINLVAIHDVSKAIRNLISEIFLLFIVLVGHKRFVKLSIFLIEDFAHVFDLFSIRSEWFLVVTNVTSHYFSDFDETLVLVFFVGYDINGQFVRLFNNSLKILAESTTSLLSKSSESFDLTTVVVQLRPE